MEFIDVETLFIGVAIIVAGGTIYAALEKLTKALEKNWFSKFQFLSSILICHFIL